MSAVLGVFRFDGSATSDLVAGRMLASMRRRGNHRADLWREAGVVVGATRYDWELESGFAGPVLVVQDADLVIAADASLYYRDDLRRKLAHAGVRPSGQTASHLILAAYRAWGERCPEELEGDFAFVLFDRMRRAVLCARDFAGKRPLFHTELPGGGLAVASTMSALLAHPECSSEIDLATVAETTAWYVSSGERTCYRAISRLDAGHTLVLDRGRRARVARHWEPPVFESASRLSFDEAAIELQGLLARAVAERVPRNETTAVWMSGGRDSTAVFAAGEHALGSEGRHDGLRPVSVSYPEGDPGCEDGYIRAVAGFWRRPVHWVNANDVPLLDRPAERAAERDEPFAHLYEMFNRTLASESRRIGARVALDGVGGDQLFLVSSVYLADLLKGGHWLALAREWKALGFEGAGFRTFFRWAVQPALPPSLLQASRVLRRGRPLRAELRRRIPAWIAPSFADRHGLAEYVRATPRPRRGESIAANESRWYFIDPFFPQVFGMMAAFALEEGVELRSPLYDRRLLAFAATRPREERCSGGDTKLLLRQAMKGLLPEEVLETRAGRTGVAGGYFDRSMRGGFADFIEGELRSPLLGEMGVIDTASLGGAWNRFMRFGDEEIGLQLFLTLQADLWLRARTGQRRDEAPLEREELARAV